MKNFRQFAMLAYVVLLVSCNLPQKTSEKEASPTTSPATTAPQQPSATKEVSPTASLPPEHHIAIRVVNGIGEFYDRETGQKFTPRGMNYVRLGPQTKMDGSPTFGHSLFDPGKYDSARVSSDLQKMHADGYNVIRVFLSPDTMGTATAGFSPEYMNNIVDLLRHAERNQIYVMFTQDWIPGGKYGPADLWRYRELFPVRKCKDIVSLGEVTTPLIRLPKLSARLGGGEIIVKDEGRLPTGSFKARGLVMAVSMGKALGNSSTWRCRPTATPARRLQPMRPPAGSRRRSSALPIRRR